MTKPVSGTKEWACHSVNIQTGCENDCRYGYCKAQAIRFGKATPESWSHPVINQKAVNQKRRKLDGTVMYPTQHDITPANLLPSIGVLCKMLAAGNKVLIVSKPHLECVQAMVTQLDQWRGRVLFRFTIGSVDDDVLGFWEPHAPKFGERLKALRHAYANGFETSVSCEPMLDDHVRDVIEEVRPYVTDAVLIGKPNKLMLRAGMNMGSLPEASETIKRANILISTFTDDFVWTLYRQYDDDQMVKWKDSIKQVIGLPRPTVKGMDK